MAQGKAFKGRQFTAEVILWAVRERGLPTACQSPAEKKSNDRKGLHSSPSAASMDSKADQRRLTVKALGFRGLPTLKLPNQRCQAQRFEIAGFLFGRALRLLRASTGSPG